MIMFSSLTFAEELSTYDRNRTLGAVAVDWQSSNLREWLNSDKQTVDYTALPPSYKDEAGFLSTNNFTQEEKEAIAVTRHGAGWQYSISNVNNTKYVSQRSVVHNDYIYNDKVFILHYTDLFNYIERNNQLMNLNTKYYSNYLQNTTNKQDKYSYLVNSGYYNTTYYGNSCMYTSTLTTAYGRQAQNIAPALSLKPDYVLSNGVKASDLKIGDIVTFGKYNNEAIEWQVINKSNSGYPLLWSTKIITIKEYDINGDINPSTSNYINFDSYDVDIATGTGENKSWETQNSINSNPIINIENESDLTTPTNNTSITLKINATDSVYGIRKITLPDGTIVNGSSAEWTLTKNGEYDIIAENNIGVITVRHIVTKAINTPAEVTITTDKDNSTKWTNKPVNVTVSATNNGVYTTVAKGNKEAGYSNTNASTYPSWMPLGGKRMRVTGTLKNVLTDEEASQIDMNACIRIRIQMRQYSINSINYTWPTVKQITLKELKEKGEITIDETITIPNNSYDSVMPYVTLMDGASVYMKKPYNYWMSDFTFEILDKDDLQIEEITLPDGNIVNDDHAVYTIFENGSYTFSARDNRGKITSKTIDLAIDMNNPTVEITPSKTALTKENVQLTINATDDLSGIKSIKLPNGEYRTNTQEGLPLSITYNIIGNGTYTFEITDFAGNKITKSIKITNIDKDNPTLELSLNPNNWTNGSVTINAKATDNNSGIKEIILPNGNIINNTVASYTVSFNGIYYFKAIDNIGNETISSITVSNIDKNNPIVTIQNNINWTNQDVQVTIIGSDP